MKRLIVALALGLCALLSLPGGAEARDEAPQKTTPIVGEHKGHDSPNTPEETPQPDLSLTQDHSHAPGEEHDHATDHGSGESVVLKRIGRFHVVVVHFPIALLVLAGAAVIVSLLRGRGVRSDVLATLLYTGAASAVVAAVLGWLHAAGYEGPDAALIETHRWWGVGTAAASLLGVGVLLAARRNANSRLRPFVIILVLLSAVVAGITGHLGGSLIFGSDFLFG